MNEIQRPPTQRVDDFRVGDWLAEPALNRLTSGSAVLRTRPQLMDVLVCLARHQGRVVLKDELLAEVWPDRIITESGMVRCIAELRQLLGDDSHNPTYIETIAKRGYRLVAHVEWLPVGDPGAVVQPGAAEAIPEPVPVGSPEPAGNQSAHVDGAPAPRSAGRRRGAFVAIAVVVVLSVAAVAYFYAARPVVALTERDLVVLAFENATGDKVFDDTLPLALAIQLEQSPFLRILSNERIREILGLMKRPPDVAITKPVGLEICERAGAAALIVGSVASLGQHYVIGLEGSACASGDVIARQQIEVASKDGVLGALGQAASRLRRDLGESRDSMAEYDVPITDGTTASLDALRALRQGDAARDRGQHADALQSYREAVARDPEFALAQVRLGGAAITAHYEPEGVKALERAFALRDRVTFPERLEIDLVYHSAMTGDQAKQTEALETMRRVYPHRASVRRRLANLNLNLGRFDEALIEALEAKRLEPTNSSTYGIAARAHFALGRWAEARAEVEEAIARGVATESQRSLLMQVGFVTGNADLVARERAWAAARPEATPYFLEFDAEDAVWHGRLRDSLSALDRYQAWALERGAAYRWTVLELRKARYEALCGMRPAALARMNRQLKSGTLDPGLTVDALKVAVSAGDMATAQSILADLDRSGWPRVEQPFAGFVQSYRAALETHAGRPQKALELLTPLIPFELGLHWGLIPLHERALAHLRAGDWQQARDAFQKMLDHPGVFSGQKLLPLAQIGLARALAAGGQIEQSRAAYGQFLALWKAADPDLPLFAAARSELAALR